MTFHFCINPKHNKAVSTTDAGWFCRFPQTEPNHFWQTLIMLGSGGSVGDFSLQPGSGFGGSYSSSIPKKGLFLFFIYHPFFWWPTQCSSRSRLIPTIRQRNVPLQNRIHPSQDTNHQYKPLALLVAPTCQYRPVATVRGCHPPIEPRSHR